MLAPSIKRTLLFALLVLAGSASLFAQTPWIHVEVDEGGEDAAHVKVNLPLSVVQIALDAAPQEIVSEGRIHLHHGNDIEIEDLRRIWSELRDSGDAELVSIESEDEKVRVRREGELLLVDIDDRDGGEKVQVEVPVAVVDALFSGDSEELDVSAALSQLQSQRGDIVRVDDGETKVRVWIDERD